MEFKDLLKQYRIDRQLTQQALVNKMKELGYEYDVTTLSKLENGKRRPSLQMMFRLSDALGLNRTQQKLLMFSAERKEVNNDN